MDMVDDDEDHFDGKEIKQGDVKYGARTKTNYKHDKIRKIKFFGYVMRHNTFFINIMEGKINGKKRVRPRDTNLGNIKKLLSLTSYEEMKILAEKREEWLQRKGDKKKNTEMLNNILKKN